MKKTLRQTNASAHLVQYRFNIHEGSPEGIRVTMEDMVKSDACFTAASRSIYDYAL